MRALQAIIHRLAGRLPGRRSEASRGATALEAALLLPALFVLLLGIIESGNLLENWLRLHKAAQAGARVAVTGQGVEQGDRMTRIVSEVGTVLAAMDETGLDVTVCSYAGRNLDGTCLDGFAGEPCDTVQVEVSYQYQPVTPFMETIFSGPVTLTARDRKVNEPWAPCN
jgi:Flp pilus assembly protein TadG